MTIHTRIATEDDAIANLPIKQATITEICKHRDDAIEHFKAAHELLGKAHQAVDRMTEDYARERDYSKEIADFTRETDHAGWQHIIDKTDFHRLMDTKARNDFTEQSRRDPPPFTPENVLSTLRALVGDSDKIFRRGLVEAFRQLDRRYKSNSAFKVRKRMILTHMFDQFGFMSHSRESVLIDIERVFAVLDGKGAPGNAGIVARIRFERQNRGMQPVQSTHESDYMKVECFKNGNMHLWFTRPDLLLKVNRMIAEEFGVVIPDDRQTEADPLKAGPKGGKADFFQTPLDVVALVIARCQITRKYLKALEPSAGTGRIACALVKEGCDVDCFEIDEDRFFTLESRLPSWKGKYLCEDFLKATPEQEYDLVAMNPPFSAKQDIHHVMHATKFLKQGGRLVAIMAASVKTRDDQLTRNFRAFVASKGGLIEDLPEGSFKESKTNVSTVIVSFNV